jgi:hypothetical protein
MRWIASRLGWSFHEKCVCAFDHAGHQERAGAVDHGAPCTGSAAHAVAGARDACDAVACNQ